MTDVKIIEMAKQAGFEIGSVTNSIYAPTLCEFELKVFAKLVAEAEREACAKIVELNADACRSDDVAQMILKSNAAAIRARGKP